MSFIYRENKYPFSSWYVFNVVHITRGAFNSTICTWIINYNSSSFMSIKDITVYKQIFNMLSILEHSTIGLRYNMDRVKRIWYLSPMRAAKVQASLPIRAVSPEPPLLAHTSSKSSGTFRQKARSLASLNGWACAVKICHDVMLEDTNSLDAVHITFAINEIPCNCRKLLYQVEFELNTWCITMLQNLTWTWLWFA